MRDDGGWGVAPIFLHHQGDAIGGQHFDGRGQSRFRQRVGILTDEERPSNTWCLSQFSNGLGNSGNVLLIKFNIDR
jgi:hypothetical protein